MGCACRTINEALLNSGHEFNILFIMRVQKQLRIVGGQLVGFSVCITNYYTHYYIVLYYITLHYIICVTVIYMFWHLFSFKMFTQLSSLNFNFSDFHAIIYFVSKHTTISPIKSPSHFKYIHRLSFCQINSRYFKQLIVTFFSFFNELNICLLLLIK